MNCKIIPMLMVGACATLIASSAQAGFQWTAPTGASASAGAPVATGTALPHVPAAPVAPVASENLPGNINDMSAGAIPTTPDGPASRAPIYGQNAAGAPMTDDPITWNTPHSATTVQPMPRAPQSVLPAETQTLYPAAQQGFSYAAPAPVAATAIVATPIPAAPSAMIAAPVVPAPVGYGVYEMAEGFGNDLPLVMAIRQVVPANFSFVFDEGINLSTNVSWQGGRPWNLVLADMLTPLGLRANITGTVVSVLPAAQTGGFQQVAMTGPAVSSDIVAATVTSTTSAPVMAPAMTYTAPSVYEGPVYAATPAATSGRVDLGATTTWTAPRNSTLRSILEDWSDRVGVELYWASEYDYPVKSGVSISGSFEEAVQTLLKGLNESKPRPLGRLHPNLPNGPAVLVIETRQNTM